MIGKLFFRKTELNGKESRVGIDARVRALYIKIRVFRCNGSRVTVNTNFTNVTRVTATVYTFCVERETVEGEIFRCYMYVSFSDNVLLYTRRNEMYMYTSHSS